MSLSSHIQQYNGHIIMDRPIKPRHKKHLSIDTQFGEAPFSTVSNSSYCSATAINIPEIVKNVKQLRVTNVEIPFTFFNISKVLKNNIMVFVDNLGTTTVFTISDGYYILNNNYQINNGLLWSGYMATQTINAYIKYTVVGNYSTITFTPSGSVTKMSVYFMTDANGNVLDTESSTVSLKQGLGWMLGYQNASYELTASNPILTSENLINLQHNHRYMYLSVNDFLKTGNDNPFICPLHSSFINKNILARITFSDLDVRPFCDTVFTSSLENGCLISQTRYYCEHGSNLQRLQVQLLNTFGNPVSLNGSDFSFTMEIETE